MNQSTSIADEQRKMPSTSGRLDPAIPRLELIRVQSSPCRKIDSRLRDEVTWKRRCTFGA
jgi:hypothetical protein